jgi:hypothetical protein
MKKEQARILNAYDEKTSSILEKMKKERDIIRQEAETLQKLQKELEGGQYWKGGKTKKKKSLVLTVATVLAWTFGFAAVNEIYKGLTSEEGLTFLGG